MNLTKCLDSSDLEWDELPHLVLLYHICSSNGIESPVFLMFGWDPAGGCPTHLNNNNRYYGTNEGKIVLEELNKLWKHHTQYLRQLHQRNKQKDQQINKNNPKFEID